MRYPILVLCVLLCTACSDDGDPAPITPPPTDTADTQGGDDPTPAGDCQNDWDCPTSTPCKIAACTDGACTESDRPDGASCSEDTCLIATCTAGECSEATAAPVACAGKQCGDDGCGNDCGSCPEGMSCVLATGLCMTVNPEDTTDNCNGIGWDGCCSADGKAVWCENNELKEVDCAAETGPAHYCGWTAESGYWCTDEVTTDPGGLPLFCPDEECTETCDAKTCGYACGEPCGTCEAGEFCNSDDVCTSCGENYCGGTCGECDEGYRCAGGSCVLDIDMCAAGDDGTGCCYDNISYWCSSQTGNNIADLCEDTCGWDAGNGYYDCGFEGADPSGENPLECEGPDPGPETVEESGAEVGPSEDTGNSEAETPAAESDAG